MISLTGNKRSFTIIEALLAAAILSIGIIGVVRAYLVMVSGIDASRFAIEASHLLKDKAADIEKQMIDNFIVPSGTTSGNFAEEYANFRWESESGDVKSDSSRSKEEPDEKIKENLSKIRVTVTGGNQRGSSRSLTLVTYMGYFPEANR